MRDKNLVKSCTVSHSVVLLSVCLFSFVAPFQVCLCICVCAYASVFHVSMCANVQSAKRLFQNHQIKSQVRQIEQTNYFLNEICLVRIACAKTQFKPGNSTNKYNYLGFRFFLLLFLASYNYYPVSANPSLYILQSSLLLPIYYNICPYSQVPNPYS